MDCCRIHLRKSGQNGNYPTAIQIQTIDSVNRIREMRWWALRRTKAERHRWLNWDARRIADFDLQGARLLEVCGCGERGDEVVGASGIKRAECLQSGGIKFGRGRVPLAFDGIHFVPAAREYEVAAPDYKNNGEYQYRLGLVYMKLGRPDLAREHLTRCEELSPGSENASKAYDLMKMLP